MSSRSSCTRSSTAATSGERPSSGGNCSGWSTPPGDEVPDGADDADWLVLEGPDGLDRTDDPDEPLRAYASPAGHIFCVCVA